MEKPKPTDPEQQQLSAAFHKYMGKYGEIVDTPWHETEAERDREFPMEITLVSRVLTARGGGMLNFSSHWHECYEILYNLERPFYVMVNDVFYELKKHDIMLIKPGDVHATAGDTLNHYYYVIKFEHEFLGRSFSAKSESKYLTAFLNQTSPAVQHIDTTSVYYSALKDILDRMVQENDDRKSGYELYLKGLLYEMIGCFVRLNLVRVSHALTSDMDVERLNELINYVEQNYSKGVTREKAANLMHMSESHFSRIFKKMTGSTFKNYVDFVCANEAEKLLLDKKMPVGMVAKEVGFPDTSSFIRFYKRIKGYTPGSIK